MKKTQRDDIVEKKLGIPADYQYKALRQANFLQSNWHSNKFEALDYCLDLNKKISVLDLGAGSGNFELLFGKKVKEITAVDYHQEALDFLDTKLKEQDIHNVCLITSDIRTLDTVKEIGTYDLIIMIDVIEHIRLAEATHLLKTFKKLLKPGGKVCIVTPNYKSLWIYIEELLDKFTIVPHFAGQQHLAQYYPSNLMTAFEKEGFTTDIVTTFNTISFLSPFKFVSTWLCKLELASRFKYGNLLLGVFTYEKR